MQRWISTFAFLIKDLSFECPVQISQALNIGIYRAIGHEGVYYGFKLGHTIPWHHGFPFNVVPHPQYVGAVLTIWGAVALVTFPSCPSYALGS